MKTSKHRMMASRKSRLQAIERTAYHLEDCRVGRKNTAPIRKALTAGNRTMDTKTEFLRYIAEEAKHLETLREGLKDE